MWANSVFLSPRPRYEPRPRYLNTSVEVFKYLDRGFLKPAIPRSRYLNTSAEVFKYLGRGLYKPSVEGLTSPRPRCIFLFLPKCACQKVLPRSVDSPLGFGESIRVLVKWLIECEPMTYSQLS